MLLKELLKHYKSYAEMGRKLGLGSNTYSYWMKIGYIPYKTQMFIQGLTNGLFKAEKKHCKQSNSE